MNALSGGHKPQKQSGLGGLASSFLGGQSSHGQGGSTGSGGGGLAGQFVGSLLGGNKPQHQQQSAPPPSSSSHQSGGLMGMASGLLGGHHGSVCYQPYEDPPGSTKRDIRTKATISATRQVDKPQAVHTRVKRRQRHISRRVRLQVHTALLVENIIHWDSRKNRQIVAITMGPPEVLDMDKVAQTLKVSLHTASRALFSKVAMVSTNRLSRAEIVISTAEWVHQQLAMASRDHSLKAARAHTTQPFQMDLVVNTHPRPTPLATVHKSLPTHNLIRRHLSIVRHTHNRANKAATTLTDLHLR